MAFARHAGHHDVFHRVLLIRAHANLIAPAQRDHAARVRDARRQADEYGRVKLLAHGEGELRKGPALAAVGGFKHGDMSRARVIAAVLLVLAGMHGRVVRTDDYQARVYAGIGGGKNRVGGNVHTHMLHACHGAAASHRGAKGDLGGNLLVRRPLAVDLREFCDGFGNFRAGRAGIAGNHTHARFPRALCHGLVAKHQPFFHRVRREYVRGDKFFFHKYHVSFISPLHFSPRASQIITPHAVSGALLNANRLRGGPCPQSASGYLATRASPQRQAAAPSAAGP